MISIPVNSAEQLELVRVGLNYKFAMQEVNDTKFLKTETFPPGLSNKFD